MKKNCRQLLITLALISSFAIFYQNCGQVKLLGSSFNQAPDADVLPLVLPETEPLPQTPPSTPSGGSAPEVSIPGWTDIPATRDTFFSCPGQVTPHISAEPSMPPACGAIPGYPAGITLNDQDPSTIDFYPRGAEWTHWEQPPLTCINYDSEPTSAVPTYGRSWVNAQKFYSIRIKPEAGESGKVLFTGYNVSLIGMVSISECPGDFGVISDPSLMLSLRSNRYAGTAPPAGQPNTVRRLFYETQNSFNQNIAGSPAYSNPNWYPTERCIADADSNGNGSSIFYHTDAASRVSVDAAQGCRLEIGKTYYINFVMRNLQDNSVVRGVRSQGDWEQVIFNRTRTCWRNGAATVCAPVP